MMWVSPLVDMERYKEPRTAGSLLLRLVSSFLASHIGGKSYFYVYYIMCRVAERCEFACTR